MPPPPPDEYLDAPVDDDGDGIPDDEQAAPSAGAITVGWARERPFRPRIRAWLCSARGLPNLDKGRDRSDPYCRVFVNSRSRYATRTIMDDLTPDWMETCVLPLPVGDDGEPCVARLRFECMDWDRKGA